MMQREPARSILRFRGGELRLRRFLLAVAVLGVMIAIVIALTRSRIVVQALGFGLPVILAITGLARGHISIHDMTSASWPKARRIFGYSAFGVLTLLALALFWYPLLITSWATSWAWGERPEDACFCLNMGPLDVVRLAEMLGPSFGIAFVVVVQSLLIAGLAGCLWNIGLILRR